MVGVHDFDSLLNLLGVFMDGFKDLFVYFTYSANDFLASLNIPVMIPEWLGGNVTPLSFMVGVALPMYLGYQFVTWLLNIVT